MLAASVYSSGGILLALGLMALALLTFRVTTEYGAPTDMVYKDLLRAEEYRRTNERLEVFNAASGGCIVLASDPARQAAVGGDFTETARFKPISDLVSRRDNANPGNAVNIAKLEMTGGKAVRTTCGCGPVSVTDIQARKAGKSFDMNAAMTNLGSQFADAKILKIRNNLLAAAVAAIDSADTSATGVAAADVHILNVARAKTAGARVTCTLARLNTLLNKMADAREDIKLFVIPSMIFADLIADSIGNYKIDSIAGQTFARDVIAALNRTVLVADIPALIAAQTSTYYTQYGILGLGVGALTATVVYDQGVEIARDILKESSMTYVREDFDVEFEIYGMKWNSATTNPTDAQLATAGNWDEDYNDHRQLKIVKGVFNASA